LFGHAAYASAEALPFSLRCDSPPPHDRIVLIVPGMRQKTSDAEYRAVGEYYAARGIAPVFVDIEWGFLGINYLGATAADIGAEVKKTYRDARICLFGFSFGAVIAYKMSGPVHPVHALLCSMSPVFSEDRPCLILPFRLLMGWVSDYSSNRLTYAHDEGECLTFLYGDHDSFLINKSIIDRRRSAFVHSKVVIVKGAGHDLGPAYLEAIKAVIGGISIP
jgi:hypothetical protein